MSLVMPVKATLAILLLLSTAFMTTTPGAKAANFPYIPATANSPTFESDCLFNMVKTTTYATLKEFLTCFRTTPMDPNAAFHIAEYAQYAWELYSLRYDLPQQGSKGAPGADALGNLFPKLMDLFTDVSTVNGLPIMNASMAAKRSSSTKQFKSSSTISEFDFYALVSRLFLMAKDRHFVFTPPPVFRGTTTVFPFNFGSRLHSKTNQQILTIEGLSYYWFGIADKFTSIDAYYSKNPSKFPGGQAALTNMTDEIRAAVLAFLDDKDVHVVSVNGVPAVEWAYLKATSMLPHQDIHASFNSGLRENFRHYSAFLEPSLLGLHTHGAFKDFFVSPPANADTNLDEDVFVMSNGQKFTVPKMCRIHVPNLNPTCTGTAPQSSADETPINDIHSLTPGQVERLQQSPVVMDMVPVMDEEEEKKAPESANLVGGSAKQRKEEIGRRRSRHAKTLADERLEGVLGASVLDKFTVRESPMFDYRLLQSQDGKTKFGWISVKTFMTDKTLDQAFLSSFYGDALAFLGEASEHGVTSLVLDVSSNSGGYISLMDLFTKIIFPRFKFNLTRDTSAPVPVLSAVDYNEEDKHSCMIPVSRRAAFGNNVGRSAQPSTSVFSAANFNKRIGRQWYADFVNGTYNHTTGTKYPLYQATTPKDELWWVEEQRGAYSKATNPNWDITTPYFDLVSFYNLADLPPTFTNVTILTNGLCGSACSMFEHRVKKHVPNVRVVTTGGVKSSNIAGQRPQTSQFCGGSVIRLSCPATYHRQELAPDTNFPFPGRFDMFNNGSFVSVEMTTNVFHLVADNTKAETVSVPQQMVDSHGDHHLYMWKPSLDARVQGVYPSFVPGEPLVTTPAPGNVSSSGCSVASVTVSLMLLVAISLLL